MGTEHRIEVKPNYVMRWQMLRVGKIISIILIVISFGLGSCNVNHTKTMPVPGPTVTITKDVARVTMGVTNFADVIAQAKPSVVAITTEVTGYSLFGAYTTEGAGSGWIINADGFIVTNNHVVEGASTVTVTLSDGRSFEADGVYTDSFSDLAVIKIDVHGLPALPIGDSTDMRVGDWVIALGNSLGLGISATKGIVSALGVSVSLSAGEELYDLIQTDAAINPGNSGGPLINLAGQVIGINSVKVSSVGVEGMGYAISVEAALPILQQLISSGHIARPDLGAGLATIDGSLSQRYRLPVSQGVLVTQVSRGGPADLAGIRAGDVIVAVGDKSVTTSQGLMSELQSYQAGQQVQFTIYKGTNKQVITVTPGQA
jgi:serine protease Do